MLVGLPRIEGMPQETLGPVVSEGGSRVGSKLAMSPGCMLV